MGYVRETYTGYVPWKGGKVSRVSGLMQAVRIAYENLPEKSRKEFRLRLERFCKQESKPAPSGPLEFELVKRDGVWYVVREVVRYTDGSVRSEPGERPLIESDLTELQLNSLAVKSCPLTKLELAEMELDSLEAKSRANPRAKS